MSYIYLAENRFMSEIANYQKIYLDKTEQIFIFLFAMRSFSSSEFFSHLKSQKNMSYKKVYTKIQRLVELGLLEAVEGRFKRNAIKYKLTTRGLFERLTFNGWFAIHPIIWHNYRDNIILQTVLYRFFETQTIWNFRKAGYSAVSILISDYLRKCCEGISKVKSESEIDQIIRNELRDLILKLVTCSRIEKKYSEDLGKLRPSIDTDMTLRADKKFFPLLFEMKDDIDKGCKIFGL